MTDPRHVKLAQVLVHHSLETKPGDKMILLGSPTAAPLLREVYREATRAGAFVTPFLSLPGAAEIKQRLASEEQLGYSSPFDEFMINHFDTLLNIGAEENTKALSGSDPQRLALAQQARQPMLRRYMERTAAGELRWCGTLFPNNAAAQDAGMSLSDYEDFVYGAELLDADDPIAAWRKVYTEQQRIIEYLSAHDEIHIVAPGTDLTYRVGGRTWINAAGERNFPDGEVFTGPIENSATGTVRFSYPAVYNSNEVEDVRLRFENGKVVEATAGRGVEFLRAMLDQDEGARFLGEVAFGLNYGITRFSRNILFDEKIGGTMHMALGMSYPETGGVNRSALHWDMICDLREGEVFADGERCYAAGRFII